MSLSTVLEYVATLIAERGENDRFLLSQLQSAIQFKFPDFSYERYELTGLKDLVGAGEKAGYFRLINTGSMQTSYLAPGVRKPQAAGSEMGANDPRRTRWMTLAMENMLSAERADQIVSALQHTEALAPEFDSFLAAQIKAAPNYATRGKLQRIREFLAAYKAKGEAQAMAGWRVNRTMLRMPPSPPIEGAGRAQSLIWQILQGNKTVAQLPLEAMDNMFFAMLNVSREFMENNKSWDWVVGLNMLEVEARAVPRPIPVKKTGLFGAKKEAAPPPYLLDEAQIAALTEKLRQAGGMVKPKKEEPVLWQQYIQTPSLDVSFRFLLENQNMLGDDKLLEWLDTQIAMSVAENKIDAVRNLANKAALVIAARQLGLEGVRKNPGELKTVYESVMEGAKLLNSIFAFINADNPVAFYERHNELRDASIGELIEDQLVLSARQDDLARYQRISERLDLWENMFNFGPEVGQRQHEKFLANPRDERQVQAEMGLLLLNESTSADERQDVIGRYPAVASELGLTLVNHTLEMLSFRNADQELYNKHYDMKRLIERCIELGVDRALAELK